MPEGQLVKVLRRHKSALGWSVADLNGIDPFVCMHCIHREEDVKPSLEMQRRLNPNMKEVVMKEVVKLLDVDIIYSILIVSGCVSTHMTTRWQVCIDYRKLNSMIIFIDQILEWLVGRSTFCFLNGYTAYNQVPIDSANQENITFTYLFGTFAYQRMLFSLFNAPATFQWCIMAIFSNMVEKFLQVRMDDFLVFGTSFESCLHNLGRVRGGT